MSEVSSSSTQEESLQVLRLTENTGKTLSCPFKVAQIASDGEGHCRRQVLDALVFQESKKVGICRRVEDDLRRCVIDHYQELSSQ
jgi:hypothetical protein